MAPWQSIVILASLLVRSESAKSNKAFRDRYKDLLPADCVKDYEGLKSALESPDANDATIYICHDTIITVTDEITATAEGIHLECGTPRLFRATKQRSSEGPNCWLKKDENAPEEGALLNIVGGGETWLEGIGFMGGSDGAVRIMPSGGRPSFSLVHVANCYFDQNSSTLRKGGGLLISGHVCRISIEGCTFSNNAATHGGGLALVQPLAYCRVQDPIEIRSTRFVDNKANVGGAIYAEYNPMLDGVTASGNEANKECDDTATLSWPYDGASYNCITLDQ